MFNLAIRLDAYLEHKKLLHSSVEAVTHFIPVRSLLVFILCFVWVIPPASVVVYKFKLSVVLGCNVWARLTDYLNLYIHIGVYAVENRSIHLPCQEIMFIGLKRTEIERKNCTKKVILICRFRMTLRYKCYKSQFHALCTFYQFIFLHTVCTTFDRNLTKNKLSYTRCRKVLQND